ITDETEVDLAGIVRVNHPKLACEIIWRKDGTLHGWDRLTSPGQIQTRSKDLASPTPQHGPSSRRQLVHQPRSNRGGASPSRWAASRGSLSKAASRRRTPTCGRCAT